MALRKVRNVGAWVWSGVVVAACAFACDGRSEHGGSESGGPSGAGGNAGSNAGTSAGGGSGKGGAGANGGSANGGSAPGGAGSGGASGGAGSGGASGGAAGGRAGGGAGGDDSGGFSGAGEAGDDAGGNGGEGGAGVPEPTYSGCSYIGGLNHIAIRKRDRARDLCVVLQLAQPSANPSGLTLPPSQWGVQAAYAFSPATSNCEATGLAANRVFSTGQTGSVSWTSGFGYPFVEATFDVVMTFPASSSWLMTSETLRGTTSIGPSSTCLL